MAVYVSADCVASIPVYEAEDSAGQWLARLERASRMYGWTEGQTLDAAACRLGDAAWRWFAGIEATTNTWARFKEAFLERFDVDEEELYNLLSSCRQECWESVREYADRYRDLASQLSIDLDKDPAYTYHFLHGLLPDVYNLVYLMRPRTLDAAIRDAIYVDEARSRRIASTVMSHPASGTRHSGIRHGRLDQPQRGSWGEGCHEESEEPSRAARFRDRPDGGRTFAPPPDRRGPLPQAPRPPGQSGGNVRRDPGRGGGDRRDNNPARPVYGGGGGNTSIDDLARQLGRLTLLMEASMGGGAAAHLIDLAGDNAEELECRRADYDYDYGYEFEAYTERASDFAYATPPHRHMPVYYDPEEPPLPRVSRQPPAAATALASSNSPCHPLRGATTVPSGAVTTSATCYPRQAVEEGSGRAAPSPPDDRAALDQVVANDVAAGVCDYPVALRPAVDCNPANIYAQSPMLREIRQQFPAVEELEESADCTICLLGDRENAASPEPEEEDAQQPQLSAPSASATQPAEGAATSESSCKAAGKEIIKELPSARLRRPPDPLTDGSGPIPKQYPPPAAKKDDHLHGSDICVLSRGAAPMTWFYNVIPAAIRLEPCPERFSQLADHLSPRCFGEFPLSTRALSRALVGCKIVIGGLNHLLLDPGGASSAEEDTNAALQQLPNGACMTAEPIHSQPASCAGPALPSSTFLPAAKASSPLCGARPAEHKEHTEHEGPHADITFGYPAPCNGATISTLALLGLPINVEVYPRRKKEPDRQGPNLPQSWHWLGALTPCGDFLGRLFAFPPTNLVSVG